MTEILKVWLVNYFHLCDSSGSHGGDYQDRFWNIPPCRPTQVGRRLRDAYWLNLLFLYHVSFTFHMSHSLHLRFFSLSLPPQPVPSVILLASRWPWIQVLSSSISDIFPHHLAGWGTPASPIGYLAHFLSSPGQDSTLSDRSRHLH
jgi:hypothetical protein